MKSKPKRALAWIARNVREQGTHDPVTIEVERNREAAVEMGAENPPERPLYTFRLGLRAGFSGAHRAAIPVFRRVNQNPHPVLKEIFYCDVAGTVLEAANVQALQDKVVRMLETIAPAKSVPLAYFRVPALDYSLPVYEDGGRIVSPVIAGPKLKADDLSSMRRHVYRYLLGAGYVTDDSQVEVSVLRPSDLRLVPPAAVIQSLDDPDLWLATVEGHSDEEGMVIGVLGETTELRAQERERSGGAPAPVPPAAGEIGSLLRLVAGDLARTRGLDDPFALYATGVRPEIWARTEQITDDVGHKLSCWLDAEQPTHLELPLRRTAAGELVTALDDRGICVFRASDESSLAARVGRYLSRHGFLPWEDAVEVVESSAAAPREPDGFAGGPEIEFSRLEFDTQEEEVGRQ